MVLPPPATIPTGATVPTPDAPSPPLPHPFYPLPRPIYIYSHYTFVIAVDLDVVVTPMYHVPLPDLPPTVILIALHCALSRPIVTVDLANMSPTASHRATARPNCMVYGGGLDESKTLTRARISRYDLKVRTCDLL